MLSLLRNITNEISNRCQFHQRFSHVFFVQKWGGWFFKLRKKNKIKKKKKNSVRVKCYCIVLCAVFSSYVLALAKV